MSKRIGKKGVIAIALALVAVIGVATLAVFTDRASHSMQFTTAKFSAEGYTLTRTAPVGPFSAGEDVTVSLKESGSDSEDVSSTISMKATWTSLDDSQSIFGNANDADNAKLTVDGADVAYEVSADKKSITFDVPAHTLAAGAKNTARDLALTIPESFPSTGSIEFAFEKVVVMQDGGGFSEEFGRTELNAAGALDFSVRVGWAASSIANQNGKALMGYLTEKDASGKYGIQFEYAFNYSTSDMKDFTSKTDAKWSYYKDKVNRLTFVEGITSIGDYAFPDFELVTSLSLPESLKSVGKWAFDNTSIPALTLPAAVTSVDTMAFGHIDELTDITFLRSKSASISFPAPGSTTGAFYVDNYIKTEIGGENYSALDYDWISDQRRVVPVLAANSSWYKGTTAKNTITEIQLLDDYTPTGAETESWDASAPHSGGKVKAYVDGTKLILAGNGSGKIYANADSSYAFSDKYDYYIKHFSKVATMDGLELLDTTRTTNMRGMFKKCNALTALDVTGFDTSKVTDMSDMFYDCKALTTLDVTGFDTAQIADMSGMFGYCQALTSLDLAGWDTSNVTTMESMFYACEALTTLDISRFETSKVTNMAYMFGWCSKLASLNVSGFDTANVTGMREMFSGCSALASLDVSEWDVSKVTTMQHMFNKCYSLTGLDVSCWNTGNVANMGGMFRDCTALTALEVSRWDTSNVKIFTTGGYPNSPSGSTIANWPFDRCGMFSNCRGLTSLDVSNWNTSRANNMSGMFNGCAGLTDLNLSGWDTASVTEMVGMFYSCEKLTSVDVSGFDTSKVTSINSMFGGCKNLAALDLSEWVTSKITDMEEMFRGCNTLTSVGDLAGWDTSSVTDMSGMFFGCYDLTTVGDLSGWNTSNVTNMESMFYNCSDLASLNLSGWNTSSVTKMEGMFCSCKNLTSLDAAGWDTSNVTNMSQMFLYCNKLQTVTLSMSFKFVDTDGYGYLPVPSNYYIPGADGKWYDTEDGTGYTPKELASVTRTETRTYVAVKPIIAPTLAENDSWYKGTTAKPTITKISLVDSYTATGNETESWDASAAQDGSIMAYVNGTELTVAGNGAGKIYANKNSACAFFDSGFLTTGDLDATKTFAGVSEFDGLNLLDTSRVTNMLGMFAGCASLKNLDLSKFDTSKVTDMMGMFGYCQSLTSLNVSSFDTSQVANMYGAFAYCKALTDLDVSNFNTSKVTNMSGVFGQCENLATLDISGWDTSSVTDMMGMFVDCKKLQTVKLGKDFKFVGANGYLPEPDSSSIPGADGKWYDKKDNSAYTSAELAGVTRTDTRTYMALPTLTLAPNSSWYKGNADKSSVTKISFVDSYTATGSETESWDASAAQDGSVMAYLNGTELTIAGNGSGKICANADFSFAFCDAGIMGDDSFNEEKDVYLALSEIEGIDLLDTSRVTNMMGTFAYCPSLTSLDLSGWDTSKVTNMYATFILCMGLTDLNMSGWDTSSVTDMMGMFEECTMLQTVTLGKDFQFVGKAASDGTDATYGYLPTPSSENIPGADGKWYDTKDLTAYTPTEMVDVTRTEPRTYAAKPDWPTLMLAAQNTWYKGTAEKSTITKISFVDSYTATGSETESWDASAAQDGSVMAYLNGTELTIAGNGSGKIYANINSSFAFSDSVILDDMDQAKVYSSMSAIEGLNLLDTSKTTNMKGMFAGCVSMASFKLPDWDTSKVTNMMGMFYYCLTTTSMDVSALDTSNVTDMSSMFLGCGAFAFNGNFTRLDLSQWNTSKVTNMSMMFGACSVESLDLAGWDTSNVTTMESMFKECSKLQTVTLGKDFKFVGTNGYLPVPSSSNISGADGKWYVAGLTKCYTPAELAKVIRVRDVTYSAIPGTDPGTGSGSVAYETDVRWPVQKGYLVYTGSEQSPDWSGYDSAKLTIGGTTSGVDVGSYTATFTPKNGYSWPDGTADTVNVTWKIMKGVVSVPSQSGTLIYTGRMQSPSWNDYDSAKMAISGASSAIGAGSFTAKFTPKDGYCWPDGTTTAKDVAWSIDKAPGSLTLSRTSMTIDYDTTASFTVARAGNGKISATSSNTDVATVSVSGNTVTVTKKSVGTAIITVEVAEGTNHTAPENKTCTVMCKVGLQLAAQDTWYKGTAAKSTITKIQFVDSYTVTGSETESWDASAAQDGSIMAYINGTELTIAGNRSGTIYANANSRFAFREFKSLTDISGLELLNTSKVTSMQSMFEKCSALTSLDLSEWDTSKVTSMYEMFFACDKLTHLDLSGWDTSEVKSLEDMFSNCKALSTVDGLSDWNTTNAKTMNGMFANCYALTGLDLTKWNTSKVTDMESMFTGCKTLTNLDVSKWDTSKVTNMGYMFNNCYALTSLDVSSFNTSGVTNMTWMFGNCAKLTNLDLSGWDTSNVTNMGYMFNRCSALTSVGDLSGWDTSKVTDMSQMFYGCGALTNLNLSGWDTSNVTTMKVMFDSCSKLQTVTLGENFRFVGTDGYLPTPSPDSIPGADGKWYDTADSTGYTPEELAGVIRTEACTYAAVKPVPTLAASDNWYRGTTAKSAITQIELVDKYTVTGNETEFWDASEERNGSVKAYISDTKLTLAGNGSGKIMANADSYGAFMEFKSLTDISELGLLNTSEVTVMRSMFENCSALTSLDLSEWDTANVTNVSKMFKNCSALTAVGDLSSWDTSRVTDMSEMFYGCGALTSLDLDRWNTSNVTSMYDMFGNCSSLANLNVANWNTSKVTNMIAVFYGCSKLTTLNLAGWDTSKVNDMTFMFEDCKALSGLDVSHFDTSNVTSMTNMFEQCESLVNLNLSGWNTSKVTDMGGIFFGCRKLSDIDVTGWGWDTSNVTTMSYMFSRCDALTSLDLTDLDTSNVKSMVGMFYESQNLTNLILDGWDTSNVTTMYWMFNGCKSLTSLDLSGLNTSKVTSMHYMFSDCSALTSVNLTGWDTSSVTTMSGMFQDCYKLTGLDVSDWDTSKVTDMGNMFRNCMALSSLDLSGWNTSEVEYMWAMFRSCWSLTSVGDISGWDTSKVTSMSSMFFNLISMTSLDLSGWDTSNVTDMKSMFDNCGPLKSLDLSGWNTSKVTKMGRMFYGCTKLQNVKLGKDFKFVGTDGYLPTPSSDSISGADGKWYDTADGAGYTPEEVAGVARTEARTYVAVKPTTTNAKSMSIMSNGNKISGYKISE